MALLENPRVIQAVDAAKALRETLKWLIAAISAVGAALLAGMQFSRIGTLNSWRFAVAVAGIVLSLGSVLYALRAVIRVLLPLEADLADAREPYLTKLNTMLQKMLNDKTASVESVTKEFNNNAERRADIAERLANVSQVTERSALLEEDHERAYNEHKYREILDAAAASFAYWKLRDAFDSSLKTLFKCTAATAIGILCFAWASSQCSEASTSPANLTINLGQPGNELAASQVFQKLGDAIGPFESGRTDRLEGEVGPGKQKRREICEARLVKAVVENAKDKRLRLLMIVGSADKFELAPSLKSIYGSNEGLAQGRADQILRCISGSIGSEISLTSIRGPSVHGSSATSVATQGDRSVSVYGIW